MACLKNERNITRWKKEYDFCLTFWRVSLSHNLDALSVIFKQIGYIFKGEPIVFDFKGVINTYT